MKTLYWDSTDPETGLPYTYDSPNVRWGFVLEPGDPGYTPPLHPPPPKPKTKTTKQMKHNTYYPSALNDQLAWLANYWNKLQGHSPALGITTAVCADNVADARWLIYVLGSWLPNERAHAKADTQAVQEVLFGTAAGAYVLPPHLPPPLPAADPSAVPPLPAVVPRPAGALNRIFATVQDIKVSATYNESIGQDLQIIGKEDTGPDFVTLAPVLKATLSGGVVNIDWNWQGYGKWLDMCEIQVNRGNGWTILTFDTTPGYTDTTPPPATLTQWKYRAIYRVEDQQVGQWSAEIAVTLGG